MSRNCGTDYRRILLQRDHGGVLWVVTAIDQTTY